MTKPSFSQRENELAFERLLLRLAALWYSELTPGVLPGAARAVIFEHVSEEEVAQLAQEYFAGNPAPALDAKKPADQGAAHGHHTFWAINGKSSIRHASTTRSRSAKWSVGASCREGVRRRMSSTFTGPTCSFCQKTIPTMEISKKPSS